MKPHYQDEQITLYHGQTLDVLAELPDGSVACCVTSPPYWGLRDYAQPGQYGLEATPAEYVAHMTEVFAEVRRVLADDGTLWLNLGDSYASSGGRTGVGPNATVGTTLAQADQRTRPTSPLPLKNLLGMPWRVAFALQDQGWILRNDIIWSKPNAMPESVEDRLSSRHEYLFLLSKSRTYWFDVKAISVLTEGRASGNRNAQSYADRVARAKLGERYGGNLGSTLHTVAHERRNPGDVWSIPTQPFSGAHFAVMPTTLASRCVQAGCKPGGTVLDPFSGSGTTGLAAGKHGHPYIGIDLSADYLDLSLRTRLAQAALLDGTGA